MRIIITPCCPKCGSNQTGFYISDTLEYMKQKRAHFLKGERVRKRPDFSCKKNLYCQDCGNSWLGECWKQKLTREQFLYYLEDRGFIEQRNNILLKKEKLQKNKNVQKATERSRKNWYNIFSMALLIGTGIDLRKNKEMTIVNHQEEQEIWDMLHPDTPKLFRKRR